MHFMNYLHTYENVSKLILAHNPKLTNTLNYNNISQLYRNTIADFREVVPQKDKDYSISFEDSKLGVQIDKTGIFNEIFTDVIPSTQEDRKKYTRLTVEAFEILKSLDERLFIIVSLLVTDIIFLKAKREGGGSASHLPGIVCISPGKSWDATDVLESLMHEATHLNLFVSDMVNGLFTCSFEDLTKEESCVVSAVRVGEMRPLDKAFHSAVVAVPLMYLQSKQGKTTLVDIFTDSLKVCSTGLMQKTHLFSPYGKVLVEQLHHFSMNQDFNHIEEAIGSKEYATYP